MDKLAALDWAADKPRYPGDRFSHNHWARPVGTAPFTGLGRGGEGAVLRTVTRNGEEYSTNKLLNLILSVAFAV